MASMDPSAERSRAAVLHPDEELLHRSELLRAECKGLMVLTSRACQRMLQDDHSGLRHRVRDVQFVRSELELKMEEISSEVDVLLVLQGRVAKARDAASAALTVTGLCLQERMKRVSSERLDDEVDTELRRERNVVEGVISLLLRVDEQITEQIRLNRSLMFHLEQDLRDKLEAQRIDQSCSVVTDRSIPAPQRPSAAPPRPPVTPEQWENISEVLMTKVALQKNNSLSLQALVDSVLEQTAADMTKQVQATSAALRLHIEDMKSAKHQMEEKVPKIQSEISDHQKVREDLQAAIADNEEFLRLAKARLRLRSQRPGKENCSDPVQAQLLAEVQHLHAHITKLKKAMTQSEAQQRELNRRQVQLQELIDMKANSIYIDEVVCVQQRESVLIPTV